MSETVVSRVPRNHRPTGRKPVRGYLDGPLRGLAVALVWLCLLGLCLGNRALAAEPSAGTVILIADSTDTAIAPKPKRDFLDPLLRMVEGNPNSSIMVRSITTRTGQVAGQETPRDPSARSNPSAQRELLQGALTGMSIHVSEESPAFASAHSSADSPEYDAQDTRDSRQDYLQCAAAEPVAESNAAPVESEQAQIDQAQSEQNEYLPALLDLVTLRPMGPIEGPVASTPEDIEGTAQAADTEPAPNCLVAISQMVDAQADAATHPSPTAAATAMPAPMVPAVLDAMPLVENETIESTISSGEPDSLATTLSVTVAENPPRDLDAVVSSIGEPQMQASHNQSPQIQATQAIVDLAVAPRRIGGLGDERPMRSIGTNIRPPVPVGGEKVDLPPNEAGAMLASRAGQLDDVLLRDAWMRNLYAWEASLLCHRPLYFEEVNVERYGYSPCPLLQPVVSGAQFFATVPILPYKMAVAPPREGIYSLGYYRPGSVAPYQLHWIPLQPKAGLLEAGVVTGLIFAIP